MSNTNSSDDLFDRGIAHWATRVRSGELSFTSTMENSLLRAKENESLHAFEHLDPQRALETATAMDALLSSGTDLGPLMGLPTGIKDIMVVDGMPTTNGSNADTAALSGSEGSVVKTLRAAGAIIIGKTCTVEYALGATGVNEARGTPWNPVDRDVHRIPGGSSSGSAVAVAAGIVGFATGTDTGGSVRIPACFTGLVGHKTTVGRWPTDGIFPLSPTLDSPGGLCRTLLDAVLMETLMTGDAVIPRTSVAGLRIGVPHTLFLDDLDDVVRDDFEHAMSALEQAGAIRVDMDFPESVEREYLFPDIVGPEIISTLGAENFITMRPDMDSVTATRAAQGLDVQAYAHLLAQKRRKALAAKATATFHELDCWMSPTCPFVPMPLSELDTEAGHKRGLLASRNTQPGNLFGFCAISLPMHQGDLPTGLQVMMPANADTRLLSTAFAVQACVNNI